jgi:integrase
MDKPLTEARIARLKHDPDGSSHQIQYDPTHPGLGVRLYPSGKKSYVMQYGNNQSRRIVTLGSIGEHTLIDAKEWWKEQRLKERVGIDLVRNKKQIKQEIHDRATLAVLIAEYVSDPDHEWSESHERDSRRRGEVVTKEFGSLGPDEVTRAHVRGLHRKITERGKPFEANRTSTFIHSLFSWASDSDQGFLPESHPNPAHERRRRRSKKARRHGGGGRNKEHKRQRVLMPDEEEFSRLLTAADSTGNPRDGVLVRLYLLTGLRTNELLKRHWSDVDWKQRILHIPGEGEGSTKNGRDHMVPLCDRAIDLLESLRDPKVAPLNRDTPIFPGKDPEKPLQDWKGPWAKIRQTADLRDWGPPDQGFKIKDLRATCSTWLIQWRERTDKQTGYLLNHADTSTSVTDAHYNTEIRRKLEIKKSLVNELQKIMAIVEHGAEKEAFSTDGFVPAVSSFSA